MSIKYHDGHDWRDAYKRPPLRRPVDGGSSGSAVNANLAQNDPTQPDYVKNRTHWVENGQTIIEWDGNTDGRVKFNRYYKVSDLTPSISEAVGGKMIFPGEGEYEITTEDIADGTASYGTYEIMGATMVVLTVVEDAPETLETGVYFRDDIPIGTSLVCNATIIHQLDEKFIPGSIARASTVKSPLVVRVRYTSNTPSFENDTQQVWGGYSEHTVDQIAEAYNSGRLVVAHIVNLSNVVELIVPMIRCKSSDNFGPASCEFFVHDDRWERYVAVCGEASSDGGYDSWTIIYSHEYSESSIGDILYVGYNGNAIPAKIGAGLQLVHESQYESLVVKADPANAGLPTPTTANNGAFLRVVDGAYTLVNLTDVSVEGA